MIDIGLEFTQAGVPRLNDSIHTYVRAIIGAHAQARSTILGSGTAFDTQKQFLANVEDAISSPVDLLAAIKRCQDVLQYARAPIDYAFGIGLYMALSNMILRDDRVDDYNNQIVIATAKQKIGHNGNVNADIIERTDVLAHGTDFIKPRPPTTVQSAVTAKCATASSAVFPTDAHEAEN